MENVFTVLYKYSNKYSNKKKVSSKFCFLKTIFKDFHFESVNF